MVLECSDGKLRGLGTIGPSKAALNHPHILTAVRRQSKLPGDGVRRRGAAEGPLSLDKAVE